MNGEEGCGDGGVGSENRDWLVARVGEELPVRGREEQRGQLGRLVGVKKGREALCEEERRCGMRDGHG